MRVALHSPSLHHEFYRTLLASVTARGPVSLEELISAPLGTRLGPLVVPPLQVRRRSAFALHNTGGLPLHLSASCVLT